MNDDFRFAEPTSLSTIALAAAAAFVTTTLLGGVAMLFQREGKPLEQWATAERACAHYAYVSERDNCVQVWLAGQRTDPLARK